MKKSFAFLGLVCVLVLSGCFSSNTATDPDEVGLILPAENYEFYDTSEFRIQYPINWKVLPKGQITEKYAATAEVAFVSNFKDMFFTPVIVVEKIALPEVKNIEDFAEESLAFSRSSLTAFEELERQTISTAVANQPVTTRLVRFTAKEKLQDDTLEYLQTYLVNGANGYIVTAAYDPTSNNTESEKIVDAIRTFKVK